MPENGFHGNRRGCAQAPGLCILEAWVSASGTGSPLTTALRPHRGTQPAPTLPPDYQGWGREQHFCRPLGSLVLALLPSLRAARRPHLTSHLQSLGGQAVLHSPQLQSIPGSPGLGRRAGGGGESWLPSTGLPAPNRPLPVPQGKGPSAARSTGGSWVPASRVGRRGSSRADF